MTTIDRLLPPTVKQVSSQAISAALQTPKVVRNVASEIQRSGLKDTVTGIVKSVQPKAEQSAASAWHALNQLPVFSTVAQAIVPTAALYTEKYNDTVRASAEKGNKVASLLPLVPNEGIAKVFGKIKI